MQNHNWTQPTSVSGGIQAISKNTNAPFINSLLNSTATAIINGKLVNISEQVSYASSVNYTHSSDLRTMQEIFHVKTTGGSSPFLGDAANATDLSDLFEPGVIPSW